tara:strand:- start:92225 stop:93364 length:1140 start_codon:yes stop_codon:yes gene_type:complete
MSDKKKMLIITSKGGGGHESVALLLDGIFADAFDVTNIYPTHALTSRFKPEFKISRFEHFYNFMLKNKMTRCIHSYIRIFKCFIWPTRGRALQKAVGKYVDAMQPDIVISVFPFFNYQLINVCRERSIPFLVLTNDLDTSNYIYKFKHRNYDQLKYVLTFDDATIREKIKPANLLDSQVETLGFPVREDFLTPKDLTQIKHDFQLPSDIPVVMLLMGGQGSKANLLFAEQICQMNIAMHLVVCVGRDEKMKTKIEALPRHPAVQLSVVGFTQRIADLMAVSDVFVTKPGPNSIAEAVYSELPMILDHTSRVMYWEQLNIDFVLKNQLGLTVEKYSDIKSVLRKMLTNKTYYQQAKENLAKFPKPNFAKAIKTLVDDMVD